MAYNKSDNRSSKYPYTKEIDTYLMNLASENFSHPHKEGRMADGYSYQVEDVDTPRHVSGEKKEAQTTAVAPVFEIDKIRHHLMVEKERDYIKRGQEELSLDQELGLSNQAQKTADEILRKDIDELTSSQDYHEVDMGVLEKLFGIAKLKRECLVSNIKEGITVFFSTAKELFVTAFIAGGVTVGFIEFIKWLNATGSLGPYQYITAVLIGVAALASWICFFSMFSKGMKFDFEFVKVEVCGEPLNTTTIRIPYGAKLKTAEAKRTDIFSDFRIVRPVFKVFHHNVGWEPIRMNIPSDPAIVGDTDDRRQFLIVYWDIEKDRARVIKDFKKFKNRKLAKI